MAKRGRYWLTEVYPDSAPADWRQLMNDVIVPWVESPLHDSDPYDDRKDFEKFALKSDNGLKKPHIHIIIHFDDVKSLDQLRDYYSFLAPANNGWFQMIANPRSYYHYLWHDQGYFPDKHPYKKTDVVFHVGAREEDFEALSPTECNLVYGEMIRWIDINGIKEISTVQRYAWSNDLVDWIFVLNRKSMLLYQYLSSVRNLAGSTEAVFFNEKGEQIFSNG